MITYFKSLSKSNKIGLGIGLGLTLFSVGCLLYLHLFGQPRTEVDHKGFSPAGIVFDASAPQKARDSLELIDSHLSEIGYGLPKEGGKIIVGEGGIQACSGILEGVEISYPCRPGWILITLWDKRVASAEGEAGRAIWNGSNPDHCTILLPTKIEDALPIEALLPDSGAPGVSLPPESYAKVGAHEVLHCRGVGHVYTPLPWPFYSVPTGAIMNPNVLKAGWGVQGIPTLSH